MRGILQPDWRPWGRSRYDGRVRWVLVGCLVVASVASVAFADPPRRVPANSAWTGSYRCSQGLTAVRLTIAARANGDAIASFEFGPHPDNPRVPHGEVRLKGKVELLSRGQLRVKLAPDGWITKPGDSWQMVGLSATSDQEQRVLEGQMDHQACGEIKLARED
jgi:hypothetical protein